MARLGARPGDWKTNPMPELVARLAYKRSFSAEEFALLQRGLMPEQMEDKWFIVWQDDALWCHRSWTGLCVYCLRFVADEGRYVVIEALVNRDPEAVQHERRARSGDAGLSADDLPRVRGAGPVSVRRYRYVGPAEIRDRGRGEPGAVIRGRAEDLDAWLTGASRRG
jgi:hypothetical protein